MVKYGNDDLVEAVALTLTWSVHAWQLHCLAAVRPCCCAPCLTRAYVKNVGRHLLCSTHSGPEGMEGVCVRTCMFVCACSGYLARSNVTSTLVPLPPFTAHCAIFYWSICNIMRRDNTDLIWDRPRGLGYPERVFRERLHSVSCKSPFPLATRSVSTLVIYTFKDNTRWLWGPQPLSAAPKAQKTILMDRPFLPVPLFSSWPVPGPSEVFLSGLSKQDDIKDNCHG